MDSASHTFCRKVKYVPGDVVPHTGDRQEIPILEKWCTVTSEGEIFFRGRTYANEAELIRKMGLGTFDRLKYVGGMYKDMTLEDAKKCFHAEGRLLPAAALVRRREDTVNAAKDPQMWKDMERAAFVVQKFKRKAKMQWVKHVQKAQVLNTKSSVRLQCLFRGFRVRKGVAIQHREGIKLQCLLRRFNAMQRLRLLKRDAIRQQKQKAIDQNKREAEMRKQAAKRVRTVVGPPVLIATTAKSNWEAATKTMVKKKATSDTLEPIMATKWSAMAAHTQTDRPSLKRGRRAALHPHLTPQELAARKEAARELREERRGEETTAAAKEAAVNYLRQRQATRTVSGDGTWQQMAMKEGVTMRVAKVMHRKAVAARLEEERHSAALASRMAALVAYVAAAAAREALLNPVVNLLCAQFGEDYQRQTAKKQRRQKMGTYIKRRQEKNRQYNQIYFVGDDGQQKMGAMTHKRKLRKKLEKELKEAERARGLGGRERGQGRGRAREGAGGRARGGAGGAESAAGNESKRRQMASQLPNQLQYTLGKWREDQNRALLEEDARELKSLDNDLSNFSRPSRLKHFRVIDPLHLPAI
jgi:hypothetical protein